MRLIRGLSLLSVCGGTLGGGGGKPKGNKEEAIYDFRNGGGGICGDEGSDSGGSDGHGGSRGQDYDGEEADGRDGHSYIHKADSLFSAPLSLKL